MYMKYPLSDPPVRRFKETRNWRLHSNIAACLLFGNTSRKTSGLIRSSSVNSTQTNDSKRYAFS